jgi:membrane-associated protein
MEFLHKLFDLIFGGLGDDAKWQAMIQYIGVGKLYAVLFAIVFAETGLVVMPFLPGDSLLFAIGALGARGIGINVWLLAGLLIVAAVLGDAVNYWVGYKLGPKVFSAEEGATRTWRGRLLNRKHLLRAQEFYEKYGGKTIILARFVPIVRTFAPFVAGVGRMNFVRFWLYNVVGGIAWVLICVGAGLAFGNIGFVKKRFELVILAIVFISVLPMLIEFYKAWRDSKKGVDPIVQATSLGEDPPAHPEDARPPGAPTPATREPAR